MIRTYLLRFSIVSVLIFCNTAFAGDIADLKRKADAGDAKAQFALYSAYSDSDSSEYDEQKARQYLQLSADNGYPSAQYTYGRFYAKPQENLQYLLRAAKSDEDEAMLFLGDLYQTENNGITALNIDQSIYWYTQTANKKYLNSDGVEAAFKLAMLYEQGLLTEINTEKSTHWMKVFLDAKEYTSTEAAIKNVSPMYRKNLDIMHLRLAAERGHAGASAKLAWAYAFDPRKLLSWESKIPKLKLIRSAERAYYWYQMAEKSASDGETLRALSELYSVGIETDDYVAGVHGAEHWFLPPNTSKSLQYTIFAADYGDTIAKSRLSKRDTYTDIDDWSNIGNKFHAATTHYLSKDLESVNFIAVIDRTPSGEKAIAFSITSRIKDMCIPLKDSSSRPVWEISGQALKVFERCTLKDGEYNLMVQPSTYAGRRYLLQTLMKANKIMVKGAGFNFPISAKGFTRSWNESTQRAL